MKIFDRFKEYASSSVLTVLLVLLVAGCLLWFYANSNDLKGLGINLVSDAIVLAITIFILDSIIQRNEEQKLILAKMSTYFEVNNFVDSYIEFWRDIYEVSVRNKRANGVEQFFTDEFHGFIWSNLNLSCLVNDPANLESEFVPEHVKAYLRNADRNIDWWRFIYEKMTKFKSQGKEILAHHSLYLDPEVYNYIHHISNCELTNQLISLPLKKQLGYDYRDESNNKFDQRPILKAFSGCKPTKEDYAAIVYLYNWCEKSYKKYSKANLALTKNASYEVFGRTTFDEGFGPRCMYLDHQR